MQEVLPQSFYARDTVTVARELVGKLLEHRTERGSIITIINETEAYTEDEASCHAFKGKTERNRAMFMEGGFVYIYRIYGMHRCINFTTEHEGRGCAVLLRGVLPYSGDELLVAKTKRKERSLDGPAKLMNAMQIPFEYYGMNLLDDACPLKIYDGGLSPLDLQATPRIGISQAKELEWRFIAKKFSNAAKRPKAEEEVKEEEAKEEVKEPVQA
jgi:DNA-3-methyladenine glycosylase